LQKCNARVMHASLTMHYMTKCIARQNLWVKSSFKINPVSKTVHCL